MADPAMDAQAKQFTPPSGKAAIYLFRDESYGGMYPITVALNGKIAGQTAPHTFFVWYVEPGDHQVSAHAENLSVVDVTAEPGGTYFVWQEVGNGWANVRSYLRLVNQERGRQSVETCRLAVPLLGK